MKEKIVLIVRELINILVKYELDISDFEKNFQKKSEFGLMKKDVFK
jgi:hypothetical protein